MPEHLHKRPYMALTLSRQTEAPEHITILVLTSRRYVLTYPLEGCTQVPLFEEPYSQDSSSDLSLGGIHLMTFHL